MDIKVFGKPMCPNCDSLKGVLVGKGVNFDYIDISLPENSHYRDEIMSKGFRSVPVVEYEGKLMGAAATLKLIEEK
jgi:glutaredoxin